MSKLFDKDGRYLLGAEIELSTQEGTHIPNARLGQRPPAAMQDAARLVLDYHSTAKLRSLSSMYNCMGMVFASRRTAIDPDQLDMILQEDGYRRIPENKTEPGDVVVYRDGNGEAAHVGIIARILVNLDPKADPHKMCVLSQWGQHGEYFHLADDVHEALGEPAEYWTDRTSRI